MKKEDDEILENASTESNIKENIEITDENDISNFPENSEELEKIEENPKTDLEENIEPNNEKETNKHRKYLILKENKKKKVKLFLIVTLILIVNLIIIFGIICAINRLNTNVYKNVFLFGKDISNYTSEQVAKFIEEKSKTIKDNFNIDVYRNDKEIYNIKSDDIDFTIDIKKTADKVIAFGREDNFFVDNYKIIKALILKNEIIPEYSYSDEKLNSVLKNIDLTVENRYSDDAYSIDEATNLLTITRGKTGNSIDYDIVKNDIITLLAKYEASSYNLPIITKKPAEIDLQKLYGEVKRNPQDAYIDNSAKPPKFVNEKNGYDMQIEKLKEVLNKDENKPEGTSIEFPLTVITPKVKLTDLTYSLYNDKLAGYTTYFDSSQKARGRNLEIALDYLNGAIVMPGKIFSYYGRVGEINYAKGYKDAATFKGGTVVYEVGGGVCQTSSTLYNVALMANMEIIERHQHGLPVGYVPPSRDATIYGNVLDFKFKNNRNYPVKIVTSYSQSGNINISIYGTKEEQEYDITLSSKVLYYIPFTTSYTYDSSINSGVTSIVNNGVNGYASEAYITKKLNGVVVSSSLLSKDVYKAQQQNVKVGTRAVVSQPNPDVNIY